MRTGPWAAIALFTLLGVCGAHGQSATEYQLKAAFLYNFGRFVEWPDEAFTSREAPFRICVFGHDPFHSDLEQVIAGKTISGRRIEIQRQREAESAKSCQILFLDSSEKTESRQVLAALRGASILTVGESRGFMEEGGVINFVLENDRVRFEINAAAAARARVRISSKLLSVAKAVRANE